MFQCSRRMVCVLGVFLSGVAGCGLLGIELFPEPTVATAQFYTVPYICESDAAGELVISTAMILHNPEADPVEIFRRGVLVVLETDPLPDGVVWIAQELAPDQAVRLDCDSFARILLDDPTATFESSFAPGTHVDGFLTIGVEAFTEVPRLDTSIQYTYADGTFDLAPVVPTLVTVDRWPPIPTGESP